MKPLIEILLVFLFITPTYTDNTSQSIFLLKVAPEERCSPYNRKDYPYSQSIEAKIADRQGMRSLYTGHVFESLRESDIEHIVALSEAHDSGLCAASKAVRRTFASDLDNLTLATPQLNRYEKRAKDAAEWLPPLESSHCWFAQQIVIVKTRYQLTADQREYDALKAVLDNCPNSQLGTPIRPSSWGQAKGFRLQLVLPKKAP